MRTIAFQHFTSASSQIFSDFNTLTLYDLSDMKLLYKCYALQHLHLCQIFINIIQGKFVREVVLWHTRISCTSTYGRTDLLVVNLGTCDINIRQCPPQT